MPDEKPRPKRHWLRRILLAVVLLGAASVIIAFVAVSNLDAIAKWSIHRVFPGVRAEMESLRIDFPSRLVVRDLELFSAATGEFLLQMQSGTATFRFTEVWRARIEELSLDRPVLAVSPKLGEALGVEPASADAGGRDGAFSWFIGKVEVRDGRLRISEFGERSPIVEMRLTATLEDFGVGGEIGDIVHTLSISELTARSPAGDRFLSLDRIDMSFSTADLFTGHRVDAVSIGPGHLEIVPDLLDFFADSREAEGSGGSSGWTVGSLDVTGLDVNVPDAPGVVARVAFRIAAALRNVGAVETTGGDSEQTIDLTDIRVESEIADALPVLKADAARATFTIAGLAERRVREVMLKNPVITVDAGAATRTATGSPRAPASREPVDWLVERVVCDYGSIEVVGIRDGEVSARAKFAIDATDLGTLGEAADATQSVTVWDVQVTREGVATPMLSLDLARIGFTPAGLMGRRIDSFAVEGGRLRVGADLQSLLASDEESSEGSASPEESGWTIARLKIAGVRTRIEDDRPGLTELRFTVNTEMMDVSTSGLSGRLLDQVQTVEFADIVLRSPLDRSIRILSLRSVFVRFALRDLAKKHLREVVILRPTIYLNQDLFVYMERATAGEDVTSDDTATPGDPQWSVGELEVKFGRLVIGSGTDADVGLPLEFETKAQNLAMDNLAALELQAVLTVPKQSYDFPDYQLEIDDVEGDLRFAYPPEKGEKNLVQKLDIAGLRWRQFDAKDAWIAATFDVRGINGQFGGTSYAGYINGGFSFFFAQDSPWIGWVAGTGIDMEAFTDVISPQNFRMTGPLDFSVQVDAFRKDIDRVRGNLRVTEPGRLKIGKLDDLLARIPDSWTELKQDVTRIGLETLRDFDYTEATGDFWFVQSQGILNLDLSGPHGSRNFEIVLHDGQETDNPWQQGRLRAQSSPSPR